MAHQSSSTHSGSEHHDHDHGKHEHDDHEHAHGEHEHGHHEAKQDKHTHGDKQASHSHSHDDHDHEHSSGIWGWVTSIFHLHGHSHQKQELIADTSFAATDAGIRTIWMALGLLGATTVLQLGIYIASGSVALFADTAHNFVDALNSLPLLVAFYLSRRAASRRYTYGFGRAEDIAGILIVASIAVSAGIIFWESFRKLVHLEPMTNIGWVAAAAVVGFLGNEGVAWLQIRTGKQIGSDAMVADGLHARTDGFTSLAVLVAALGTWLGFPIVDPVVGLLIGVAILFIAWDATKTMWYRLMDAVDPELVDTLEATAAGVPDVQEVSAVRVRWVGHRQHAELCIKVNEDAPVREGHRIAEEVRHAIYHELPLMSSITVHIDPCGHSQTNTHEITEHHEAQAAAT